jgi:hypothetical protein
MEERQEKARSAVSRLSEYYLACLSRDNDRELSAFASSRRGPTDYAELPSLPFLVNQPELVWGSDVVQRAITRFRRERRNLALYLGYPTRLVQIKSRRGWTGFLVEPILVFEVVMDSNSPWPMVLDFRPEINLKALGRLSGVDHRSVLDDSMELESELGLDNAASPRALAEVFVRLREIRPQWPWREELVPEQLNSHPKLSDVDTDGIYNRAILISSELPRFTRGLERELKQMVELDDSEIADTALGHWLDGQPGGNVATRQSAELIEVFPLNVEQRSAVREALSEPLTVITGPPGTGKSQVIASVVANCAWRGQTVLVASKNNKAVDVVEERVNSFDTRPLLLRLGALQYQTRLREYLSGLLSATFETHDQELYLAELSRYEQLLREREKHLSDLHTLIDALKQIYDVDRRLSSFRSEIGGDAFHRLRVLSQQQAEATLSRTRQSARDACVELQGGITKLIWPLIRRRRHRQFIESRNELESLVSSVLLDHPDARVDDPCAFFSAIDYAEDFVSKVPGVQDYFELLERLEATPSTSQITKALMNIGSSLHACSRRLWRLWLRLRPAELDPETRKLLADYRAALELVIWSNQRGEQGQVSKRL